MANTTFKGEIAVQKVILRAIEKDVIASKPVVEGCRYDLVLDVDGLKRTQVKYAGQTRNGAIKVLVASQDSRGKKGKRYGEHEVDLIIAYSPITGKFYKLPPEVWRGKRLLHLRYEPSKNNQKMGCFDARDFEW